MKIQMPKMRVLPLLMVTVLMIVIPIAAPQDLERIPIDSVVKDPSSFTGRIIQISGHLEVLKEQAYIYDDYKNRLDAWIAFENGWKKRSPKSAVKELAKLRRKSGASWPHRGVSVIELDYRYAYVELEGVMTANPEYRTRENEPIDPDNFRMIFPINTVAYVFNVHRILSLRDKKANNK